MPTINTVVVDPNLKRDSDAEELMTEQQAITLRELSSEADEPFDGSLTHRQAERRIALLQEYLK